MKTAVVATSLLAALAISAQAIVPIITINSLTVEGATNAAGSNVTVRATIGIADISIPGQVTLCVMSTNGLIAQLFPPEYLTFTATSLKAGSPKTFTPGTCTWTNTSWNPYFTGDFNVTVVATELGTSSQDVSATAVTVVRTIGGTVNSVKVAADVSATAYDANMVFTNIDVSQVALHNIKVTDTNVASVSIGCNLMNNPENVTITTNMSSEDIENAYMDTGAYRTNGTPFRFDMTLHARPTGMMGFGEIMRFVWTPTVASSPAGAGNLVVDVLSCQPWRSGYTNKLSAHVGCAPLFVADTNDAALMQGMIMSTTAHYLDVNPVEDDVYGIGLKVNGQSNKTSNLKAFVPDAMLAKWGIPVAQATNLLVGYTTHFTSNNVNKGDTVAVTTTFKRIAGGDTNYAYSSTNGDSGYEVTFTFAFQSPVAAQVGVINHVFGDYDGDGRSDLAVYRDGYWSIFTMAGNVLFYQQGPWGGAGWTAVPGDYDGDGRADLAMYRDGYWSIFTMAGNVLFYNQGPWGGAGWTPVPGDYDGDGKSDLAVYRDGYWSIFTMAGNVLFYNEGVWGGAGWTTVPGDYDGDRRSDLAVYREGYWSIFTMAGNVLFYNEGVWGGAGWTTVPGDYDNDGRSDLAVYRDGYWSIFTMAGNVLFYNQGPWGGAGWTTVPGDYDGDGMSDFAVYRDGYWSIFTMAGNVLFYNEGPWGGAGWTPER